MFSFKKEKKEVKTIIFKPKPSYSYDDIGLVPIYRSNVNHRDEVSTSVDFFDFSLPYPILVAPMQKVVGLEMSKDIAVYGGLAFLPRTDNMKNDIDLFAANKRSVPSIPMLGDAEKRISELHFNGCTVVCIDVANGFHKNIAYTVHKIKKIAPYMKIIAGNIASLEGYKYLSDIGVNAVRVGIGGGSVCTTSIATGIGVGQATLIREIANYRESEPNKLHPLIIADTNIKTPGDVAKAIALGADITMAGGIFAGTDEAPGHPIKHKGELYKHYAGQASLYIKGKDHYVEGVDTLIKCKGPVAGVVNRFQQGLKSSMSYMDTKCIADFKYLPDECFTLLSNSAKIERNVTAR